MKIIKWGYVVTAILLVVASFVFLFGISFEIAGVFDAETPKANSEHIVETIEEIDYKSFPIDEQIYNALIKFGISPAGACGILANAKAESDLQPDNLENFYNRKFSLSNAEYTALADRGEIDFVHDAAGYGLWQFTYYSFKQVLLDAAKVKKTSVSDIGTQVEVLVKILETPEFSKLFKFLKTTDSPEEAAKEFMLVFERPANQSESAIATRVVFATEFYKIFN